ncbi:MAG: TRAP transporter fused permease subunit [Betaproteobacteria bacterium]|nr:TRAP transporter fused permease subunit [Betaproteobacteria bacterium]
MSLREKAARAIALIVNIEAAALVLYELSFVWFQTTGPSEHYAIFFGAVFSIVVLKTIEEILTKGPGRSRGLFTFKLVLLSYALFAGLLATVYIRANLNRLENSLGLLDNVDITVGLMSLAGLCIAGYFSWGLAMVIFALAAVSYFLFGDLLPGFWGHPDYGIGWVLSYTTLHPVLGTYWLIPLSADVIFYVLLFSGVMASTGTVSALLELGKGMGRRVTGGVAYPALIGSACVGTMVGQAVANVVITGRITIPAMKQQGVQPSMAAAVEASASAGSLIMPPIMGLGAFVMAFYLNVPYIEVALAATIPAILYYSAVGVGIYFNAKISQVPRVRERVDWHLVGRVFPTFLIGVGVLSTLLLLDYTTKLAGFWALVVATASALLIQGKYRPPLRAILNGLLDGCKTAAELGVLLALVGPVAQTIQSTGLGVNLANALIISPVGQVAMLALPIVTILTLITGAAIIEAATYIILALVLAPFLEETGFNRMAAHMFIYYYAVFATLTPPIAITAAAASRIGQCNFWDTCFRALRLAFVGIVVPYVFIFNPALLEFPRITLPVLVAFGLLVAGLVMLSASFWGWLINPLSAYDRLLLAAAGFILLAAAATKRADLTALGVVLGGAVWAWQWFKKRRAVPALVGEPGDGPPSPPPNL